MSSGGGKPTSRTFGQPIETRIGDTKVKLRVDAQAGQGKDSTVDIRIDPNMQLEPQIPKNLNLNSRQKNQLLNY